MSIKRTDRFTMKLIYTLLIALTLLISACAPMGSSIVIDDTTMSNNRPQFLINFNKPPIRVEGTGSFREFYFSKDKGRSPLVIGYNRWIESNNLDYYYSLPHIVSNRGFIYFGPIHFADHEWAKVGKYDNQYEHLTYGYFTRKDNSFIFVLDRTWEIERETKHGLEQFIKTPNLSDIAQQAIDSKFEHLDAMIEIVY